MIFSHHHLMYFVNCTATFVDQTTTLNPTRKGYTHTKKKKKPQTEVKKDGTQFSELFFLRLLGISIFIAAGSPLLPKEKQESPLRYKLRNKTFA